jgi:Arc/MetJ-type ribon-helix-helix transcriptional regulator
MKTITLKIDEKVDQKVRKAMVKHNYSTVSEFYREAVRNQLSELEKKEALQAINRMYGYGKRTGKHTTDKDIKKARKEMEKEMDKRFGIS